MEVDEARVEVTAPSRRGPGVDPFTAMAPRFGRLARAFGDRFFAGFGFEEGVAQQLRALEAKGAVVYVMRYSSRLDYFLFNWLFVREHVRLATFANGIKFYYYRPVLEAGRLLLRGIYERLRRGFRGMRAAGRGHARAAVNRGGTVFLFLRTDKVASRLRPTRRGAVETGRSELDYLREVVDASFDESIPISLVPLALFWRKGPRPQRRRFLNLFYGAPERPTDTGKVLSFLWNYRNLAVRVGTPIDLRAFVDARRDEGPEAVVKKVRRSLLIFLRREEKPIAGATLRLPDQIAQLVLRDPDVVRAIEELSAGKPRARARLERRAARMLRNIAAAPSSSTLAILDVVVTRIFGRLFDGIEVRGLDRVVEAAKQHPLVLVPCHRSHFDYVILSWLFYERHLVPPLVAAGDNLAFWPLGTVFRRGGAFFLRRSFEGDRLYSTVFRCYVQQLIKDGVTQEFFIEGTRSRTGRTLSPRLGMLSMILEAFQSGVRQDVQIVPIGFTYERLVEEGSMVDERRGGAKTRENLFGLVRSGRVLKRRFGNVTVQFGEPISLAGLLGPGGTPAHETPAVPPTDRAASESVPEDEEERAREARRRVAGALGTEIVRRINGLIAATRTSVPAAVLLAGPGAGIRREDLVRRSRELVAILEMVGTPLGEPLTKDLGADLESSLKILERERLVARLRDRSGEIVHIEPRVRDALDYYRGGLAPALALAGSLALALPERRKEAQARASDWLELLALEFFPPPPEERARIHTRLLDRFRTRGWTDESGPDGYVTVTAEGREWIDLFRAQILPTLDAYRALFQAIEDLGGEGTRGALLKAAREAIRRALLLGEMRYSETESPSALDGALALLIQRQVLVCEGNPRRDEARVRPGARWSELPELRARLADPLATR